MSYTHSEMTGGYDNPKFDAGDTLILKDGIKGTATGKQRGDQYFAEDPEAEIFTDASFIWINEYHVLAVYDGQTDRLKWKKKIGI